MSSVVRQYDGYHDKGLFFFGVGGGGGVIQNQKLGQTFPYEVVISSADS